MQRTFKYRLYPNRKQRETLAAQLEMCRELYNAALQERMESYRTTRKGVTWLQQQAQLPAIKEVRPEFKSVHAHTLQAVLIRLNRSFQNFFRRVQKNESPGFPRFKGRNRFNSLVCTPTAFQVQGHHVAISKVGNLKIKMHRRLPEKHGTLFLKQICGSWYACFSCHVAPHPSGRGVCHSRLLRQISGRCRASAGAYGFRACSDVSRGLVCRWHFADRIRPG